MSRSNFLKTILITFISLSASQFVQLTYASDSGTTGANFLKIGIGPRAVGMGEAQVAICNDVTSVFWNPAGLVKIGGQEASFMCNLWLEGTRLQYFGYTCPHPTIGTFAGSINYLSMDKIQGYTANDVKTGKVTAHDLLGVISYARELPYGIYGGINLKFIQQKLEKESSFATGFDIGVIGSLGRWLKVEDLEDLTIGLNLQNFGSKVEFQKEEASLPLNFKFGVGLRKEVLGDPLTIAIDGNLPNDNDFYGSLGIEYWVRDLIALRLGYKSGEELGNGLSFGAGIKVNIFQLDYALVHFGELGYTHRIGIVTRFGKEAKAILIERAFKRGMEYYNGGKYPEAILEFNKVLRLDPENERALAMMKRPIASASEAINAAQGVGADTSKAEALLEEAKGAFDDGYYGTATSKARAAESLAKEARQEALAKAREEEAKAEEEAIEVEELPIEEEKGAAQKAPKIYVVRTWERDRDCLWNIAKKCYGDPWKWERIYKANRDKIVDPDLIYLGQRLVIP